MGNCIGNIQCIQLLKKFENELDDSGELLSTNLINEPSVDIEKKKNIWFSKKQNSKMKLWKYYKKKLKEKSSAFFRFIGGRTKTCPCHLKQYRF